MSIDVPPKLWVPAKPAVIRSAPADVALVRKLRREHRANLMPGWFPAGAMAVGVPPQPASVAHTANSIRAADLASYTFLSQPIGTAATGRRIVVGPTTVDGTGPQISSVTVGGNATRCCTGRAIRRASARPKPGFIFCNWTRARPLASSSTSRRRRHGAESVCGPFMICSQAWRRARRLARAPTHHRAPSTFLPAAC